MLANDPQHQKLLIRQHMVVIEELARIADRETAQMLFRLLVPNVRLLARRYQLTAKDVVVQELVDAKM